MTYKTPAELSRLSRIRDTHIRRLRRKGKSEDYIQRYLRGWSTDHYRMAK